MTMLETEPTTSGSISPRLTIVFTTVSAGLYVGSFLAPTFCWRATVTIGGLTASAERPTPATALYEALTRYYRKAGEPLPPWASDVFARVEASETRAIRTAMKAFARDVGAFATVEAVK